MMSAFFLLVLVAISGALLMPKSQKVLNRESFLKLPRRK